MKRAHHQNQAGSRRRRGFTLVELVVSMVVASIVMIGAMSAMTIAMHALPSWQSADIASVRSSDVVTQLADELAYAIYFMERTTTTIAFTVADRDNDGIAERIRYTWSGDPFYPAPLKRQYNDDPVTDVLANLKEFSLGYELEAVADVYPGLGTEGPEIPLSIHEAILGTADKKIEADKWTGQYFQPALPGDAFSWSPTRVAFWAKADGPQNELTYVQLRTGTAGDGPTQTVLQQFELPETSLNPIVYEWVWQLFDNVRGISPGSGLCLVLKHSGVGAASARIVYDNNDGVGMLQTEDAGTSWNYYDAQAMRHYVFGTVTTAGANRVALRQHLTGVRLRLERTDSPTARAEAALPVLNAPETLAGFWELDFDCDPTTVDVNGDAASDWVCRGGGSFDTGSLVNGVWHADTILDTYPDCNFTELTTADVRFRNTSMGGQGAVFSINLDHVGSDYGVVRASLMLQPNGTQMLIIYTQSGSSTSVPLRTITGLSNGFVDLQLIMDPDLDTVSIRVNDAHQGTYNYTTFSHVGGDRFATVRASGSNAEFDAVRIRVGGQGL